MSGSSITDCEGFHRRDFLTIGAGGLFGLTLSQLLHLQAQAAADEKVKKRANAVLMLWLGGGPSHQDMWDLKPEASEGIRSLFQPIPTKADGVYISEHLPKTAQAADKIAIVRSLSHTIPAHGPASVFMTTGNKPTPTLSYPSMGSLAAKLMTVEKGVPPYVSFNNNNQGSSGYLGTAYNPFIIESSGSSMRVRNIQLPSSITLDTLEKRDKLIKGFDETFRSLDRSADLIDGLDAFHKQALEILRSDKTKKAFDLDQERATVRERYGSTQFGRGVLAARRLVEAGVRFATISLGGWDTHGKNFDELSKKLLPSLDQTLSALVEDLNNRGLLDSTIVYCAGEFGRTPKINKNAGRDHWARSMAVVLAGGGLKRGYVHGSTDAQGMVPANDPCTPDDVAATIFHCLGIDPHTELTTSTGRPIQLFREGRVIEKLIA
ncbi:MAG TPA: DUF1501 domain-containing protein [Gemmataceae bacterium]|nr:DUF1501 domain-containing protein [Gemmataceae bacterium]